MKAAPSRFVTADFAFRPCTVGIFPVLTEAAKI